MVLVSSHRPPTCNRMPDAHLGSRLGQPELLGEPRDTDRLDRVVPNRRKMPARLIRPLHRVVPRQNVQRLAAGDTWQDSDLVRAGLRGKLLQPNNLTQCFGRLAKQQELDVR